MIRNYLSAWRKHRGQSQTELAEAVGTTLNMLGKLERGERTLDVDWLEKLGEALRIEPYHLIAFPPGFEPTGSPASLEDFAAEHGLAFVEEVDLALGMGATYLDNNQQPEVLGLVPFREEWLRDISAGDIDRLKVVRGRGDSMQPTIWDGDVVLIDTAQRRIDDQDRIWALAYGDLGVIRRVRVTPRGTWMLMPDNQVVRPDEVADNDAYVIGRVVWIGRKF